MDIHREFPLEVYLLQAEHIDFYPKPLFSAYLTRMSVKESFDKVGSLDYQEVLDFVARLIYMGHTSVFEHQSITFVVENISRVAVQQLTRHRLASYTQESFRIREVNNFVFPFDENIVDESSLENVMNVLFNLYNTLVENGVSKDHARYILPMGSLTTIVVTMNFRELIHFISLRSCSKASEEIRLLSKKIVGLLSDESFFPIAEFLRPQCFHLGYCPYKTPCELYKENIKRRKELFNI